jgi:hypothetical protein
MSMPVVRQLRIVGCLACRDRAFGPDGEVDPAVAVRTPANKTCVVPPRADEGVVDRTPVIFQTEINRLHRLPTADMGTLRLGVDDRASAHIGQYSQDRVLRFE